MNEVNIVTLLPSVKLVPRIQGNNSGRGTLFLDTKVKVPPQYKLLIKVLFQCQQKLVLDQMDHPVESHKSTQHYSMEYIVVGLFSPTTTV